MDFNNYSEEFNKLIETINFDEIGAIAELIWDAYKNKKNIFVAGNGGSASTASHMAADIGKNATYKNLPRFKTISLVDNIAWTTALSNDLSYDDIFIEQLKNFAKGGDVFIVFSVSGNSKNLVKAVRWANKNKLITIGFLGKDGGLLSKIAKNKVVIKSKNYGLVESAHSFLHHYLVESMCFRLKQNYVK